jgi:hypothetical protein
MTRRLAGWIVGALAVALVLSMLASSVGGVALLLAVPVAVVASILTQQHAEGHKFRDVAERLVSAAAAVTGERTSPAGEQVDWGAALRAELATITVPRERRRFAVGAAVALLGRPHSRRSFVVASAVAVAFGAGLLGVSRAGLGDDGLASVTLLLPPVVPFTTDAPGGPREPRTGTFGGASSYLLAWNGDTSEILRLAGFVMLG